MPSECKEQKIAAISQADLLTLQLDKVNARNTFKNAEISLKRAMSALATFLNLDKNTVLNLIFRLVRGILRFVLMRL